jgi:hypothetical protein
VFPVVLKPDAETIAVDGLTQPLTSGMAVTVELKTGARRMVGKTPLSQRAFGRTPVSRRAIGRGVGGEGGLGVRAALNLGPTSLDIGSG